MEKFEWLLGGLFYLSSFLAIYIPVFHKTINEPKENITGYKKLLPRPTKMGWIFIVAAIISFWSAYEREKIDNDKKDIQNATVIKDINIKDSINNIKWLIRDKKNDSLYNAQKIVLNNSQLRDSQMALAMKNQGYEYNELDENMEKLSAEKNKIEEDLDSPLMIRPLNYENPTLTKDSITRRHNITFSVGLDNESEVTITQVKFILFFLIKDSLFYLDKLNSRFFQGDIVTKDKYIISICEIEYPKNVAYKMDSVFVIMKVNFTNKKGELQEPYYDMCMLNTIKWTLDTHVKNKMKYRILSRINKLESF